MLVVANEAHFNIQFDFTYTQMAWVWPKYWGVILYQIKRTKLFLRSQFDLEWKYFESQFVNGCIPSMVNPHWKLWNANIFRHPVSCRRSTSGTHNTSLQSNQNTKKLSKNFILNLYLSSGISVDNEWSIWGYICCTITQKQPKKIYTDSTHAMQAM